MGKGRGKEKGQKRKVKEMLFSSDYVLSDYETV
jgi:hypothetical protein